MHVPRLKRGMKNAAFDIDRAIFANHCSLWETRSTRPARIIGFSKAALFGLAKMQDPPRRYRGLDSSTRRRIHRLLRARDLKPRPDRPLRRRA
jgi:hypothetical protein